MCVECARRALWASFSVFPTVTRVFVTRCRVTRIDPSSGKCAFCRSHSIHFARTALAPANDRINHNATGFLPRCLYQSSGIGGSDGAGCHRRRRGSRGRHPRGLSGMAEGGKTVESVSGRGIGVFICLLPNSNREAELSRLFVSGSK